MIAVFKFFIVTFMILFVGYICVMVLLAAFDFLPKKIINFKRNLVFELYRSIRFQQLFGWMNLNLYERAQATATYDVIVRYARGNILFQNGLISDDRDLQRESRAADRAMDYLEYTVS